MMKNPLKSHYECVNFDTNIFMPKLAQRLLNDLAKNYKLFTLEDMIVAINQELHDYLDANQNIEEAMMRLNLQVLREAERAKGMKLN